MRATTARTRRELAHYFRAERSAVPVPIGRPGLVEVRFGEYLIERGVVSRADLFRALCEQDRHPGVRLGEMLAALGAVPYPVIERLLGEFLSLDVVEVTAPSAPPVPFATPWPESPHR